VDPPAPPTDADAAAAGPVVVRRPAATVVSLAALEARRRQPADGGGTDPGDAKSPADSAIAGPQEAVLRAVLAVWDFRDADGWQQPLADALCAEASRALSAGLGETLAAGLRAFAESELRRQIVAANEV